MDTNGTKPGIVETLRNSALLRLLLIGFLILLLQIPIFMIDDILGERETRRYEAVREITSKWGAQQSIIGPIIMVPYLHRIAEVDEKNRKKVRFERRLAFFLPEELKIDSDLKSETRYRGILEIPVYAAELEVSGRFLKPDFSEWGIDAGDIQWDRAQIALQISDVKAIANSAVLEWKNKVLPFMPGCGELFVSQNGIHVPMGGELIGDVFPFTIKLKLNGSEALRFAPLGKETIVKVKANWPNPSFQGDWLPTHRQITEAGFEATWSIPSLGRSYPQRFLTDSTSESIGETLFGVDLATPVDHYRMSERSLKYSMLFFVSTFLMLWLFETLAKIRVHSIQYLLVGAALCIFYLLAISLAEHIGFTLAYSIATMLVTSLVFFYCRTVLRVGKRAAATGGILLMLYAYLYFLLMNQDYALLIGSIGLFTMIGAVMFITRKVDWYTVGSKTLKS
jgi:inner membrane protein